MIARIDETQRRVNDTSKSEVFETPKAKIERYAKNLAAELAQDGAQGAIDSITIEIDLYPDGSTDIDWRTEGERSLAKECPH